VSGPGAKHGQHAVRFLLQHLAIGSLGGFLFGGLVLYFNMFGLGDLVIGSASPGLALFLLFFGLFVTFGSLGMGVAVMSLGQERDSDPIE